MDEPEFVIDADLLGLKYELIEHLGNHDIAWFQDFSEVEADLGNRELKVYVNGDYTNAFRAAVHSFAREHKFKECFFSEEKQAVYMRRGSK